MHHSHVRDSSKPSSVDQCVEAAIVAMFPGHSVPDEKNRVCKDRQVKAPDHDLLDGRIFVERKSRRHIDDCSMYKKVTDLSSRQGARVRGYGIVDIERIIEYSTHANLIQREFVDYGIRPIEKAIKNAKRKFFEYRTTFRTNGIHVLIISDDSDIFESTEHIQQFIGRKMGGIRSEEDISGSIDAIVYVKNPAFVNFRLNSFNAYPFYSGLPISCVAAVG